ncbi:MAG: hypothetical protein K0R44_835, partial [Thermomicrobiales bacterium]|nr:hypothetical protein [Thermomicrobiales bacterium]
MTAASKVHPWVAVRRDKITFALQVDTRS